MSSAARLVVDLDIPAEEYLRYYEGGARVVLARARDGRTVQFPANLLRRFVAHDGVHGSFMLRCDANGRLVSIARVGEDDGHG